MRFNRFPPTKTALPALNTRPQPATQRPEATVGTEQPPRPSPNRPSQSLYVVVDGPDAGKPGRRPSGGTDGVARRRTQRRTTGTP